MEIPPIGKVTKDDVLDWYYSEPIRVPVLGDQICQIIVEGYDEDSNQGDFHTAIKNFLSINESVLKDAESDVFQLQTKFIAAMRAGTSRRPYETRYNFIYSLLAC